MDWIDLDRKKSKKSAITFVIVCIIICILFCLFVKMKTDGLCDKCKSEATHHVSGSEYCDYHYSKYLDKLYKNYNDKYYK